MWCVPLIPALGRQRQADLFDFEVSLVYKSQDRLQSYRETLSQRKKKEERRKRKKRKKKEEEGRKRKEKIKVKGQRQKINGII